MKKSYKNYLLLIVNDFSLDFFTEKQSGSFEIPPGVIVDGLIKRENHLYYLIKKCFEKYKFFNKKVHICIISSRTYKFEFEFPKVKNSDVDSMLKYKIEDTYPIKLEGYNIVYKYKIKDRTLIQVRLAPRKLIEDFSNIFKKFGLDIYGIYFFTDILNKKDTKNFVYSNFSHLILNSGAEDKVVYFPEYLNMFEKYQINSTTALAAIEGKFIEISDNLKNKIVNNMDALINSKRSLTKNFFKLNNFFILASQNKTDFLFTKENNIKNLNLLDFNMNTEFNFYKKIKKDLKINIYIILFILIFICFNVSFYLFQSKQIKRLEVKFHTLMTQSNTLDKDIKKLNIENVKIKNKKLLNEINNDKIILEKIKINKKFEEIFINLENLSDDDIFFTEYYLQKDLLFISGIGKNIKKINNILGKVNKDFDLIQKNEEYGFIKFKIKIQFGD